MDLNSFKIVPTFPDYLVNESGIVYSTLSNKILVHRIRNKHGYLFVTMLDENKISKNVAINRLVAHVYLGMKDLYNDLEVDHIDRDILNNHYSNLQVLTKDEHHLKTLTDNNLKSHPKSYCNICNKQIKSGSKFCFEHYQQELVNPQLTIADVEEAVRLYGWKSAGKLYNLSDNGLRKNYKRLGGDPNSLRKTK